MRRLLSSLSLLLLPLMWIQLLNAQSTTTSTSSAHVRSLNALLQDYAYRAFNRPRTGTPYDAPPPSNLTGVKIAALRLRSGSLRTHGVQSYKEFEIPMGVVAEPYVERLVLVYQNLENWTAVYYSLSGYTFLTPVLGLLAYDALDLSAKNLPELSIRASGNPILIKFTQVESVLDGLTAKCVWFDLDGLTEFSNVSSGNVCSTMEQGHFAIVVESTAPSPAPLPPPPPPPPPPRRGGGGGKNDNSKVWIIVGSVVGGFALLVLLSLLACWLQKYKKKNKMQQMEKAADVGESLNMASVGNTRAPVAMGTRTQPVLENEYVP